VVSESVGWNRDQTPANSQRQPTSPTSSEVWSSVLAWPGIRVRADGGIRAMFPLTIQIETFLLTAATVES
jgi:hypothetical protein